MTLHGAPAPDRQGVSTSDADELVEALVAGVLVDPSRRDELVALLREDAPIYADRGAAAAVRLRGWITAAFGRVGLPDAALPFVLEDLQSELDPFAVAGAARAVRAMDRPSAAAADALVDALIRLRARDDTVSFESLRPVWPVSGPTTTARGEVLASIRWCGDSAAGQRGRLEEVCAQHAPTWSTADRRSLDAILAALPPSCCGSSGVAVAEPVKEEPRSAVDVGGIRFEDQDGRRLTFHDVFAGRRTVVALFYTRCPNPNKCSLTITKLAELQRRLDATGAGGDDVGIAAITYDPGFDGPARIRGYGESRGLRFDGSTRMLRATDGHDVLVGWLGLRVGYVGSIVNRHAVELFLVVANAVVVRTWARVRWDVDEVVAALGS